jgi:hypothetical protein
MLDFRLLVPQDSSCRNEARGGVGDMLQKFERVVGDELAAL